MKYLLILFLCFGVMGCRTVSTLSTINPVYEKCLEEGKEPPKDMAMWIPKKKLELRGVGKNEVDMTEGKETMKQDSGIKIPEFPKVEFEN